MTTVALALAAYGAALTFVLALCKAAALPEEETHGTA